MDLYMHSEKSCVYNNIKKKRLKSLLISKVRNTVPKPIEDSVDRSIEIKAPAPSPHITNKIET